MPTHVTRALIEKAKGGDVLAAREVFDRLFGKASQPLEVQSDAPRDVMAIFRGMDDRELIRIIRQGDMPLPPILEQCARQIEAGGQPEAHPDGKPDAAHGEGN